MSLTDVMSGSGLAGYAEIALVISLATFLAIAVWTIRRPRAEMDARARAVLDDDEGDIGAGRGGRPSDARAVENSEN